jgi:hypothetical protein
MKPLPAGYPVRPQHYETVTIAAWDVLQALTDMKNTGHYE